MEIARPASQGDKPFPQLVDVHDLNMADLALPLDAAVDDQGYPMARRFPATITDARPDDTASTTLTHKPTARTTRSDSPENHIRQTR